MKIVLLIVFQLSLLFSSGSYAGLEPKPIIQNAIHSDRSARSQLLAVASNGKRLLAVGERGFIVYSDDDGISWKQANKVPVSVTLTSVSFIDKARAIASGHMGVVLASNDSGATWNKELDGVQLIERMKIWASASDLPDAASSKIKISNSIYQMFSSDGPDKPFFATEQISGSEYVAVGAFGLAIKYSSISKIWSPLFNETAAADSKHIYGWVQLETNSVVVGEQGLVLVGKNLEKFEKVEVPLKGTLFGIAKINDTSAFAYGLNGGIIKSFDSGQIWKKIPIDTDSAITSGSVLLDGRLAVGTGAGDLYISDKLHSGFVKVHTAKMPINGLVQTPSGAIVLVGPRGIERVIALN